MDTITVNGIDFNVETNENEIHITNINDEKVVSAEVDENIEQGSYTLYYEDGDTEEQPLPREVYDNIVEGNEEEATRWLCSIAF